VIQTDDEPKRFPEQVVRNGSVRYQCDVCETDFAFATEAIMCQLEHAHD
jgi:hypothetical protein